MFGKYGDLFLYNKLIFRILTNYHPKDYYIAYPIYELIGDNKLRKMKGREKGYQFRKFLKTVENTNIRLPLIEKEDISEFYDCMNIGEYLDNFIFQEFYFPIKNKLEQFGFKNIGLTGSVAIKSYGYDIYTDDSDLDFILYGKEDSIHLEKIKPLLFDNFLVSYSTCPEKLYRRRKRKKTVNVDMKTIKLFEATKPIGLFKDRHINITPTYNLPFNFLYYNRVKKENLGLIETFIEIKNNRFANSVPGVYEIKAKYKGLNLDYLVTNFFSYSLGGKKGDIFLARGNLIKVIENKKEYYILSLEDFNNHLNFCLNIQ